MARRPAQYIESAEQAVLGALLHDPLFPKAWESVADVLRTDDFLRRDHQLIFDAIKTLSKQNIRADVITVSDLLEKDGELEKAGGLAYIGELANNSTGTANIAAYAEIVRKNGQERLILTTIEKAGNAARAGDFKEAERLFHLDRVSQTSEQKVSLISGADIKPERVDWLWQGYLARGKLHILAGAPSTGKTTIALALAATVTLGGHWPDGTRSDAGNILMWSGEDGINDTLLPRLMLQGADRKKVFFVGDVSAKDGPRSFDPATDMQALHQEAERIGNVRLIIVDPIVNMVTGDGNSNSIVRRNLQPIVDLASKLNAVALGISHFSKGTAGRDPVERVTGSLAFGALARVVLAAAKIKDNDGNVVTDNTGHELRMFVRAKCNLGPEGDGFNYVIDQREIPGHSNLFASRVLWCDPIQGSAKDLLLMADTPTDPEERGPIAEAVDWLSGLLVDTGEMEKNEIIKLGKTKGHAERTIHRARTKLGIKAKTGGFGKDKHSLWSLPNGQNTSIPANRATNPQSCHSLQSGMIEKVGTIGGSPTGQQGPDMANSDFPQYEPGTDIADETPRVKL